MALNLTNFKTTDPLATISTRFGNEQDQYVGLKMAPLVTVPKAQFKFYQYDKSNLRVVNAQSESKAEANEVQYDAFTTSALCKLRKLKGTVDPADERDADAPMNDIRTDVALQVMDGLLIDFESIAYTLFSTSTNYESANSSTLGAGLTWKDAAGDPLGDSRTSRQAVKNSCGKYANCVTFSSTALEWLMIHPSIVDRIKYTSGTSVTEEMIRNLFRVKELLVASAIDNSAANQGDTDSLGEIWSNVAVFFYRATMSPSIRSMHFASTFGVGTGFYTRTYQVPQLGAEKPLEKVESGWWVTPQLVALQDSSNAKSAAGYLLQGIF